MAHMNEANATRRGHAPMRARAVLIQEVLKELHERSHAEDPAHLERFVTEYLRGLSAHDLAAFEPMDRYGAVIAHWNLAARRLPGEVKVRVYNPQAQQHGWQSTHSVIEIVCDDAPFLFDSLRMALERQSTTLYQSIHPVMLTSRDADGHLNDVRALYQNGEAATPNGASGPPEHDYRPESFMHVEVDRQPDDTGLRRLELAVTQALRDVGLAVSDWQSMLEQIDSGLKRLGAQATTEGIKERHEFLRWLRDDHFTFLGFREYRVEGTGTDAHLKPVAGSGLGLLRETDDAFDAAREALRTAVDTVPSDPATDEEWVVISKVNERSPVHRSTFLDYIGIKMVDESGVFLGEQRFVGLLTAAAYNRSPLSVPLLKNKLRRVLERAEFAPQSHAGRALVNVLETFPRDDLMQLEEAELFDTAIGILHLQERPQGRLFIHRERFGRFYFCLAYVPRERFNTTLRRQLQELLEEALDAQGVEFNVHLSDSMLARIRFILQVRDGASSDYNIAEIEAGLVALMRSWNDELRGAVMEHFGEAHGAKLWLRYGDAFRADYREQYAARIAVHDIERMEALDEQNSEAGDHDVLALSLYRPLEASADRFRLKLFRRGSPLFLSAVLPMLENMGLRVEEENPAKIKRADGPRVWMHDFGLATESGESIELDALRENFENAFSRVWSGTVENDSFNRLVLAVGLHWREVVVLRAYGRYLRQIRLPYSQEYFQAALANNPRITRGIIELFKLRFDPHRQGGDRRDTGELLQGLEQDFDSVTSLDEDRILRSYIGLVYATVRTNYYQSQVDPKGNAEPKSYVSFKFDPKLVPDLPRPKPMHEIFVYSPRVEGVHLRGGPVARGGLRWSDRPEDFRTEVLGLVKAQMVKNAVIVPVGSKGGFVVKRPPTGGRDEWLAEGIACYQTFIRGMLDITDNLHGGETVPPADVVRQDPADPYLVVAADKGTATFSDIANQVAADYNYWLDDAFASGGSAGYDHKGMGITAKGAWESVKRHFREYGLDTQNQSFTVVGIGDMGGDVFGNGMLLSKQIKLLFAFNHLHLFVDPDPDPDVSFNERRRLFELPRSSWEDYDASKISAGGGVFSRALKSIPLSAEMQAAFGVQADQLTPNELIHAALKAPVDLLWNGGIGTFVKSEDERNEDVGDRANDAIRVSGNELRCRVVGEGGNLGCTQLGRIEFARNGGRIFTDAIDNAAGVDCSDHEVNIKVLLNALVESGDMTDKQRRALLAQMTEDVGSMVVRNNYLQTQALSMARAQAVSMLDVHARVIRELEKAGQLERTIEYLPSEDEILERKSLGQGLLAPEIAVLMAYVKIQLFELLLEAQLGSDEDFSSTLIGYFPPALQQDHPQQIREHRLANEIVATVVANEIVNRAGTTFLYRIAEETGASAIDIARAFKAANEILRLESVYDGIESLDNRVDADIQTQLMLEVRRLQERVIRWLLRNLSGSYRVGDAVQSFAAGIAEIESKLDQILSPEEKAELTEKREGFLQSGVPEALASRLAGFDQIYSAFDIVMVSKQTGTAVVDAARTYHAVSTALGLGWLHEQVDALPRSNRWQTLARNTLRDDLFGQERALTVDVVQFDGDGRAEDIDGRLEAWLARSAQGVTRCKSLITDIQSSGGVDFAMLSVVIRELRVLQNGAD